MSVVDDARSALSQQLFEMPPNIPIVRWEVEDITDQDGEDALQVLLVLDESVDPEKINGRDVGELKYNMRQLLRQTGITLFPYISFAKQSELDEPVED
jgi:hypothetical protein